MSEKIPSQDGWENWTLPDDTERVLEQYENTSGATQIDFALNRRLNEGWGELYPTLVRLQEENLRELDQKNKTEPKDAQGITKLMTRASDIEELLKGAIMIQRSKTQKAKINEEMARDFFRRYDELQSKKAAAQE